jgi:hypothetical protein
MSHIVAFPEQTLPSREAIPYPCPHFPPELGHEEGTATLSLYLVEVISFFGPSVFWRAPRTRVFASKKPDRNKLPTIS